MLGDRVVRSSQEMTTTTNLSLSLSSSLHGIDLRLDGCGGRNRKARMIAMAFSVDTVDMSYDI